MSQQQYSQVPSGGEEENESNAIELTGLSSREHHFDDEDSFDDEFYIDDDESDDENCEEERDRSIHRRKRTSGHVRLPMELIEEQLLWNVFNRWEEPNLLSLAVTTFVLIPNLILWMYGTFEFAGKWWALWILVLHLQIRTAVSSWYVKSTSTVSFQHRTTLRRVCSIVTLGEVLLCGIIYPLICKILIETFFRDVDGTIVPEWRREIKFMFTGVVLGWIVVILRCCIGLPCLAIRIMKQRDPDVLREWRPIYWTPMGDEGSLQDGSRNKLHAIFRFLNYFVFGLNLLCTLSLVSHFGPWPAGVALPEDCDPLDDTECMLPFPSFHHLKEDRNSPTGWRVNLKGMPPLRGGIPFHMKFLHDLDGFSTMGPMLFYMKGLKETHEMVTDGTRASLQGPDSIALSVTRKSITLLLDVQAGTLVHHSAEIDYLDPKNPLVMIFPSEPLKHASHYAVAVLSATDHTRKRLPRTKGMVHLMKATHSHTRTRFMQRVIPALERAASWFSFQRDPEALQLLFDFVTISEDSQLGPVRDARDIALEHVQGWNWEDHARVVSIVEGNCFSDENPTARTVHLSLDVPSFLHSETRYSFLDPHKLNRSKPPTIGEAKAMVQIPCSVKNATLEEGSGQKLRAILEFGHGLFGKREEIREGFLQTMGNENGYITMAMDWRGMSRFDVPVVLRTLLGKPDLFQAPRDNLIQGFANKLCLQHFSKNGMLEMDAFHFDGKPIPTFNEGPTSVFYGISQGGILGGGYMSLAGTTNLIDRGILGSAGTPFALVLTRSLEFGAYDKAFLMNFYKNRHVRMVLGVFQMAWDSTETSGFQGRPVSEPIPPLLIQAGLGDPIIPSHASESLARAMGASVLPSNPHPVFGLATESSRVVLSELLYEAEYEHGLPSDNKYFDGGLSKSLNKVHWCVRWDAAMIQQVEAFINTGTVIDPCQENQCHRASCTGER